MYCFVLLYTDRKESFNWSVCGISGVMDLVQDSLELDFRGKICSGIIQIHLEWVVVQHNTRRYKSE